MAEKTNFALDGPPKVQQPKSAERKVPMKVLCLGYGRTGTMSLRGALMILGFNHTYHTVDAVTVKPYDCKLWLDALKAKHDGVGKIPGREEFDQLLGHCQAVTDMPAAYFAPELIHAYPEAKVILTTRDVDKWHKSVQSTLQVIDNSHIAGIIAFTAKLLLMPDRWVHPMFQKMNQILYKNDFKRNGRMSFEQHYEFVRSLVPPEKLLEYNVSQGWEPLCKFLDKPIPSQEIPFVNEASGLREDFNKRTLARIRGQLKRILDVSAYTALGIVLIYWMITVIVPISK